MAFSGVSDKDNLIPLLRRMISSKGEVLKFAVAASGPKDGLLYLSKKDKLKKDDVRNAAETESKEKGGKGAKFEIMTGECQCDGADNKTLRLTVYGRASKKAVDCLEHLLVRGPYKVAGFKSVAMEEVAEQTEGDESGEKSSAEPSIKPAADADLAAQWKEQAAAWGPAIKAAIAAKGATAGDMTKLLAQATSLSKPGGDLEQALEKLTACHALATAAAPAAGNAANPMDRFTARFTELLSGIKAAAGTPAGDEAKLRASEAGVYARKQDFAKANQLLDQVRAILEATAAPSAGGKVGGAGGSPGGTAKPTAGAGPAAGKAAATTGGGATGGAAGTGKPPVDPPRDFEAAAREVQGQIAQLTRANPFRARLSRSLETLEGAVRDEAAEVQRGRVKPGQLVQNPDGKLDGISKDALAARSFENKLDDVREQIQALTEQGDFQSQLLARCDAELATARQNVENIRGYVSGGLKKLAAIEQAARSSLPPAVQPNVNEFLALRKRAFKLSDAIDAVEDDDVRGGLRTRYRQLERVVATLAGITAESLAAAKAIVNELEKQLTAAAPGTPTSDAEATADDPVAPPEEPATEPEEPTAESETPAPGGAATVKGTARATPAAKASAEEPVEKPAAAAPTPPPPPRPGRASDAPGGSPSATAQAAAAAPAAVKEATPGEQFKARLTDLLSGIKAAAGTPAGDEAKLRASEAGVFARKQDFAKANELLDQVDTLLKGASPSVDPVSEFQERVQAFRPSFDAALAQAKADDPELADELDGLFAQMYDEAKAQQVDEASQTLAILSDLVARVLQEPGVAPAAQPDGAAEAD